MTSERQRQANRANAQSSTGPKTAKGKKRSAVNARRHGLNVSVLHDPLLAKEVEALARRLAGPTASPEILFLPAASLRRRSICSACVPVVITTLSEPWPIPSSRGPNSRK